MTRHRFEPARLLLGLLLLGAGLAHVLDASGALDLPTALLPTLVPAALALGALAGLAVFLVRRGRCGEDRRADRRTASAPGAAPEPGPEDGAPPGTGREPDPPPAPEFPLEELRRGYERSRGPHPD
ncbi:hypothetical protein [Streptomyces sp. JJ36]|uniref:hypothetical protein n=1 Tax=Streptomyces sp. JJ36 TaxID=2736645 RepID=UPI001F438605|nr:hypothetical protein [Streptomyces sp. JJ36]MCF6526040.1 hypothetical protein [Streptomyces sp. JJ36]